jgi:hypothetical protein
MNQYYKYLFKNRKHIAVPKRKKRDFMKTSREVKNKNKLRKKN